MPPWRSIGTAWYAVVTTSIRSFNLFGMPRSIRTTDTFVDLNRTTWCASKLIGSFHCKWPFPQQMTQISTEKTFQLKFNKKFSRERVKRTIGQTIRRTIGRSNRDTSIQIKGEISMWKTVGLELCGSTTTNFKKTMKISKPESIPQFDKMTLKWYCFERQWKSDSLLIATS